MEVRGYATGPIQENCYIIRGEGEHAGHAVIIDPGEDAPVLLAALEEHKLKLDSILVTHCHFDHVGAVAAVARATGAHVWCPESEVPMLQDIDRFVSFPGLGPFESYDPEHTVVGGERLQHAGYDIDVVFTPGHSPGHVTYVIAATDQRPTQIFSGDVLFQGSIGRTDLPGGDHSRLLQSIAELLERYEDEANVYPGHMDVTTLGRERASNPFLIRV